MITFKPFKAYYPNSKLANKVAALPYDVFSRLEAKVEVNNKPYSFLRIDRAETNFDSTINLYSDVVYKKASSLLQDWINEGIFLHDNSDSFYLYELSTNNHSQTGIVGLTSVNDLINGFIKDHEKTRIDKQLDRVKHIEVCNAHTGPILMFHSNLNHFDSIIESIKNSLNPIINFVSDDLIQHRVFRIDNYTNIEMIKKYFNELDCLYIADGHHRAAAAKQVAINRNSDVSNTEISSNLFLSVVFSKTQMRILDYNRVIKDLNGYTVDEFINEIKKDYSILKESDRPIVPLNKGQFSMFIDSKWVLIQYKHKDRISSSIDLLDVSILQDTILNPLLNIKNPSTDNRIDFVGGVKGLEELERRVLTDCKVAFALVPTSIDELIEISNQGQLMPPKSTWFEPKLRSGLFIHLID